MTRIPLTLIALWSMLVMGSGLGQALFARGAADLAAPPPIPPVLSVTEIGTVGQNPVIYGRDGTFSALINGKSYWTFGDTAMSVPGVSGNFWVDNSLSWTTDLDASDGITLESDYVDSTGAPAEFLAYTTWEKAYNYAHDPDHCTAEPCGAEYVLWPAQILPDPERNRSLVFYGEIWRVAGEPGWRYIGSGIAVGKAGEKMRRPVQNSGSQTPTLMWTAADGEVGMDSAYVVVGTRLYAYGCSPEFLVQHCIVGRVALSAVLDKSQWRYYAGAGRWSPRQADAVTIFDGGAAGNTVFYVPYLGLYMLAYNGVFSDDIYYRVARNPWGPWSKQTYLFTGRPGWEDNFSYAGRVHPEYAEDGGRVQYITYVHATGFLRWDLPLVQVVFGDP